ncbi:MAG: pirin-like C-terminal cupin domain-containing protein, partial [Kiloniellales bacterium]
HNAFAYVFEGDTKVAGKAVKRGELAVLSLGEAVSVSGGEKPARLILVAGKPLREPVARYGPFVMNHEGEIRQAILDFQAGRF